MRIAEVSRDPVISIIDDDEAVRVATENLVRSLGFGASTFASAEEFLQSTRLHDTSCLITDVQMPGMTGVELQSYLLDHGHDLPIIFITAFPEERVRERVDAAGAIGFLSKPFDGGMMIQCIDKALRRRSAATQH
jgi:FixJ family two-component response regulator